MILEDVVEDLAYARSGYSLAAFKEAALPVYVLSARVLTLEKKPISPIEEACLKALEAGLDTPNELCAFLGLSMHVLKGTLANLNSREQINYIRPVGKAEAEVTLTQKGRTVLSLAKTIEPEERLVKLVYDSLLKRVVFLPTAALFSPREVKERGWMELPTCGAKRPEVEDVPLADIDKAVQRAPRGQDQSREFLAVKRIERRELQFTPCIALYYRAHGSDEIQVAFVLEDGPSLPHETAFAQLGGPNLIGAQHVLQRAPTPPIDGLRSVHCSEVTEDEVDSLARTIAAASVSLDRQDSGVPALAGNDLEQRAKHAMAQLKAMTQRPLRCHEHPRMLTTALTKTQRRLLIVSPWVNHYVVNEMFVRSLEALLRNGVEVSIGYGLADEGDVKPVDKAKQKLAITPQASKEFDGLRARFDNLSVKFIGNTHRKQLVSDDKFAIITSFNWLSFKGDPRQKARDELGFLISDPAAVEEIFQDGLRLIGEGYDHPPSAPKVSSERQQSTRR